MKSDWILVPKVATEGMHEATLQEWDGRMSARSAGVYDAMLSAAPAYEITEADVEAAQTIYVRKFAEMCLEPTTGLQSAEARMKHILTMCHRAVLTDFVKRHSGEG